MGYMRVDEGSRVLFLACIISALKAAKGENYLVKVGIFLIKTLSGAVYLPCQALSIVIHLNLSAVTLAFSDATFYYETEQPSQ